MDQLEGRTAVVTGSASGLGRAMAERFAREGMTVVIADNRLGEAEVVAKGIEDDGGRAVAVEVDVTRPESLTALADRVDRELGGTALLVNNAGVVAPTPVHQPGDAGWRWIVDVNLFGVVYGIQTFLPRMLASGGEGHIVNTSSFAGVVGGRGLEGNHLPAGSGTPDMGAMYGYMATKHAVVAVTETLAGDLSGTRIGVSLLCPSHHENTGIWDNSPQFRPATFGGPMSSEEVQSIRGDLEQKASQSRSANQRYPEECAARVLRAVRERQFYIFTHPETRPAVEYRFSNLLAGFDDADSFRE